MKHPQHSSITHYLPFFTIPRTHKNLGAGTFLLTCLLHFAGSRYMLSLLRHLQVSISCGYIDSLGPIPVASGAKKYRHGSLKCFLVTTAKIQKCSVKLQLQVLQQLHQQNINSQHEQVVQSIHKTLLLLLQRDIRRLQVRELSHIGYKVSSM